MNLAGSDYRRHKQKSAAAIGVYPITTDSLHDRDGLPDALKVLLEAYPRQGWTQDPGFDDLIKFWLDRHLMFRRIVAELSSANAEMLDKSVDPQRFAAKVSRYGGHLVNGLHEHHTIEDTYYFPKLVGHDPRIARGFDILDADHHALDGAIASFVETANGVLQTVQSGAAATDQTANFAGSLGQLEKLLDRHLTDEEDLIVPLLLKFGSPMGG